MSTLQATGRAARLYIVACAAAHSAFSATSLEAQTAGFGAFDVPTDAVLSADGRWAAFRLGDTLFLVSPAGVRTPLVGGMRQPVGGANPFVALSSSPVALVFRQVPKVRGGPELPMIVEPGSAPRSLGPDSIARSLSTFQGFYADEPEWDRSGKTLLFLASDDRKRNSGWQVWRYRRDQGSVDPLTAGGGDKLSATWSPDGRTIAYAERIPGDSTALRLLRIGVRTTETVFRGAGMLTWLSWSPDGALLLAQRPRTAVANAGRSVVVRIRPNRRSADSVTSIPSGPYAGWSGPRTLVTARGRGMHTEIATLDVTTGATTTLLGGDLNHQLFAVGGPQASILVGSESGDRPLDLRRSGVRDGGLDVTATLHAVTPALGYTSRIHRWRGPDSTASLEAQVFVGDNQVLPAPTVIITYGNFVASYPSRENYMDDMLVRLVSRGYVVVRPNTRGRDSDRTDTGRYGEPQLEDIEALIASLSASGVVDRRRVAVMGQSHGAGMTYYFLTHSRRFCAGVAVNGVADWEFEARRWIREFGPRGYLLSAIGGTPDSVPAAYARSPIRHVDSLAAPLLAVVGGRDRNVSPRNALRFAEAALSTGAPPVDLLVLPDAEHHLGRPKDREALWGRLEPFLARSCP